MGKLKLLSSVAVAALIAMPAFAQTSSSPTTSPSTSRPATTAPSGAATSRSTLPSDIHAAKVSDLVGKNVYNSNNEKVGDINDIVVPKSGSGQAMAVIGVGGFLGIGEKEAAVPLDQLKIQDDKIVAAGMTKEQLKDHADYKKDKDNYTKLDRNQVVGQASGTTGSTTRPSTSGSSTTGSSSTGSGMTGSSSSGSSGSSGSVGSTGSSSSPSGSSSTMGSSAGSSSTGSPNPSATSNPPDNSTATKKQ
jgi:sporulation protein YlmC with PRC-barrel domain